MHLLLQHHASDWQLEGYDVHFDGEKRLIVVDAELSTALDIKTGVYQAWKAWNLLPTRFWNRWIPAIRTTGGDPTVQGQTTGDVYFLINGWRIQHDPKLAFTGALFSDDFDTPSIDFEGNKIGLRLVSSLVTAVTPTLEGLSIPTAEETAAAVRAELATELTDIVTSRDHARAANAQTQKI